MDKVAELSVFIVEWSPASRGVEFHVVVARDAEGARATSEAEYGKDGRAAGIWEGEFVEVTGVRKVDMSAEGVAAIANFCC